MSQHPGVMGHAPTYLQSLGISACDVWPERAATGTGLVPPPERLAGTPERSAVIARMKDFLEFARSQGYQRDEVLAMMESLPQPESCVSQARRTGIFSVGSGHPPMRRKPFVGCVGSVLLA
jgi:hypothetical protein